MISHLFTAVKARAFFGKDLIIDSQGLSNLRSFNIALSLVCALLWTFVWSTVAFADSPGDLDATFNQTGVVTTSLTNADIYGTAVVIQPDGKILVGGRSDPEKLTVVRYDDDGSLDTGFGIGGIATSPVDDLGSGVGNLVALDTENRIVVAGTGKVSPTAFQMTTVRFTSQGQLDLGFGNSGVVTTSLAGGEAFGHAVAVQPDNKPVVAGQVNSDLAVVRYTVTGTLDTGFSGSGVVTTSIGTKGSEGYDLAIQADGKIVVAGVWADGSSSDYLVARYQSNGTLDMTLNGNGIVTTSLSTGLDDASYYGVAIQKDNKIVAVGEESYAGVPVMIIARYQANGHLDSTFNGTGIVTTSIGMGAAAADVAIQADGKIIAAGVAVENGKSYVAVVRYRSDGNLDAGFGGTGIITTSVSANRDDIGRGTAIQPDGKIVVAGFIDGPDGKRDMAVLRYLGDGYTMFLPLILKS